MIKTLSVAVMILVAHAAAFAQASGTVTGRVLSPDGTPAANVRVAAIPESAFEDSAGNTLSSLAETNSAGQYRLENIPPGEYRIVAGLLEWLTYYPGVKNALQARIVSIAAGRTISGTDFTLQRPQRLRVSGRIVRTRESSPLPQRILLNGMSMNGQQQTVVPAADGTFEFKEVFPGNYNLQVSPGIPGVTMQQFVVEDKDVQGLEFVVPLSRTVRGRVQVEDGTQPPPLSLSFIGARGNFTARSGSAQSATFSVTLPEGEHRLGVTGFPAGLAVKSITMGSVDLLRTLLVIGDAEPEEVVVTFSAPTAPIWLSIKGRVIRPAGSAGTPPTRVMLTGSATLEVSIAADGSFEFPNVLPGNYNARVQPNNGTYPVVTVNLFKDIANLEIALPREHEVKGRVLVEQDGFLPRFTITAAGISGTQINTTVNGPFTLTVPEGEYTLRASGLPAGYNVKSMKAGDVDLLADKLRSGSGSEIVVTLGVANPPPWRAVRGRIVDPSANASLELRVMMNGGGYRVETKAGVDGTFEFPKVLQGTYTLQPITEAGLTPLPVVVADRDVNDVRIAMPRRVTVTGRIQVEGNRPLPLMAVILKSAIEVPASIQSSGLFRMRVPEGEYEFQVPSLGNGYIVKSITAGAMNLLSERLTIGVNSPPEIVVTLGATAATVSRRIRGRVTGMEATASAPIQVVLTGFTMVEPTLTVTVPADGAFEFDGLAPGPYNLMVLAGFGTGPPKEVTITTTDADGIELSLPRPLQVDGRIVVDGPRLANLPAATLSIRQARALAGIIFTPAGAFRIPLTPGEYDVRIEGIAAGYELRSILYGAVDLQKERLNIPETNPGTIVVQIAAKAAGTGVRVGGVVRGGANSGNTPRRVVLIPVLPDAGGLPNPRLENQSVVAADGTFQLERIPPGTYEARLFHLPPSSVLRVIVGAADIAGLEIIDGGQIQISGSIEIEGDGSRVDRSRLGVFTTQANAVPGTRPNNGATIVGAGTIGGVRINQDWSFLLNVQPGESMIQLQGLPADYAINSMTSGTTDLLQQPLRVDPRQPVPPIKIVISPR